MTQHDSTAWHSLLVLCRSLTEQEYSQWYSCGRHSHQHNSTAPVTACVMLSVTNSILHNFAFPTHGMAACVMLSDTKACCVPYALRRTAPHAGRGVVQY
jgi:hypothetical protein